MLMRLVKRYFPVLIPLLFLGIFTLLFLSAPDVFEPWQNQIFDQFQKWHPRPYQEAPVAIVDLDDASLEKMGQWPWPRTRLAELVHRLTKAGAAAIAFDIVFAEPDRTSPSEILKVWDTSDAFLQAALGLEKLPEHDTVFSEAIEISPVILGIGLTSQPSEEALPIPASFAHLGPPPQESLPAFQGVIQNIPVLEENAAGVGSFNFMDEKDGIIRRVPLLFNFQNHLVPSLAAEALRVAQGAGSYIIKSAGASGETGFGEKTGLISMKVGELEIPTGPQGRLWLYETPRQPGRYIPAWQVFEEDFDPDQVAGKILFVGTSAVGLKDLRNTPLQRFIPGVEIHAQISEQILTGTFLNRPDWAPGAEFLYLLLIGLLVILTVSRFGARGSALFSIAAMGAVWGLSWFSFLKWHFLLDPLVPSLAILIIYITASFLHVLQTEHEKKHIREAFSRYMAPALVEQLAANPETLRLGGEKRVMTFLFSDIRNFTNLSESLAPEDLTFLINRHLTPMTDIVLKHHGTIDKYMGDCIMAFWNAPLEDPDHVRHACNAALEMKEKLGELNTRAASEKLPSGAQVPAIEIGIGLNTGEATVGNFGSEQRFDYSVIGDAVNLASRLEGLNKTYGSTILAGESVYEKFNAYAFLEQDKIRVKGKTQPVKVYALLGREDFAAQETFEALQKEQTRFLNAFRKQQWEEAEKLLGDFPKPKGQENFLAKFAAFYHQRIEDLKTQQLPPHWDGVMSTHRK